MCSSAPAICCARAAAPSCTSAERVEPGRRADRERRWRRRTRPSSRGSPARLVPWLIATAVGGDQRDRRSAAPWCARTAMCPALRANGTCRARPLQLAVGAELDMAVLVDRRDRHRPGRRRDPGLRQEPAGQQRLGQRHRRGEPAGDAQHGEPVEHAPRRRRRASSGTQVSGRPDSSSASHSAFGHSPFSAALIVFGSHRSAKIRVAVSTMMLSVMWLLRPSAASDRSMSRRENHDKPRAA